MPRLNDFYRQVAEEFARRLVAEFDGAIESVVLYGPVARKQAKRDSDVDLMVVCRDVGLQQRVLAIGYALEEKHGFDVFVAPFVVTAQQLQRDLARKSPFMWRLVREGTALYDRGTFERICQSQTMREHYA